jgi:hypothetical protein
MLLFSIADTGMRGSAPVVTIPANQRPFVGHSGLTTPRGGIWGVYFQVRKKPMSPGMPPGYSSTSAFSPKPNGLR